MSNPAHALCQALLSQSGSQWSGPRRQPQPPQSRPQPGQPLPSLQWPRPAPGHVQTNLRKVRTQFYNDKSPYSRLDISSLIPGWPDWTSPVTGCLWSPTPCSGRHLTSRSSFWTTTTLRQLCSRLLFYWYDKNVWGLLLLAAKERGCAHIARCIQRFFFVNFV